MTSHFKIYIAAYLILAKGNEVLCVRRCNTGYQDGKYSFVAGHLDGGETARQAIIREANEEIGITLKPEHLDVVHVMHRYRPDREYIDIYLRTDTWEGDMVNKEPEKCDEILWCPLVALPQPMVPEVSVAMKSIQNSIFYGEYGW